MSYFSSLQCRLNDNQGSIYDYILIRPMEVDFLVHVSARMDFFYRVKIFHRSSQIVFSDEAPESDKIGI